MSIVGLGMGGPACLAAMFGVKIRGYGLYGDVCESCMRARETR